MNYIYGPIPSRRLGQSLGVDPIPLKTCNWNCIYCQLGRTMPLTNERREYVPRDALMRELEEVLAAHGPGEIDYITFVGSGEPTLHVGLGWMIRRTQAMTDIPVAVITNGSTLYLPDVRADLALAHVVMPTLSAGSPEIYRTIHRPHPHLSFEQHLEGLIAFRRQYEGRLWVELMLIKGVNDSVEALADLAAALAKVQPDLVQINIPNRPPAETWVQPPDEEGLMRAAAILGDIAQVVHPADGSFDLSGYDDVVDAIVGVITRHPMRQDQLEQTLARWAPSQVQEALDQLLASGRAQQVERLGVTFWSAAPSRFPDAAASEAVSPARVHARERMVKR